MSAAPTTVSAPPSAAPISDVEAGYSATAVRITGDTGRVRYDVLVPQVEGGDPAVTAEFDESMRAALQDQIDGWPGSGSLSSLGTSRRSCTSDRGFSADCS
ncbi:hypothetical protein P9209_06220 [Prescottella defluvii]|nr:hypothetical protein P9209_06220 [Prescottella defluvii]